METSQAKREQGQNPSIINNWEKEELYGYSDDQLIDAFEVGREKGRSDARRIVVRQLEKNLKRATKETEDFADLIQRTFEISIQSMHMKVKDITSFSSLIVVDSDTYFDEKMKRIYNMVTEAETELRDEEFKIVFRFTFGNEDLNRDAIISDGYYLRYSPESARES